MRKTVFFLMCVGGFLLLSANLPAAERQPLKPASGDKCPVCGMFVAKFPDWVAEIVFQDGSHSFFDGVKDMMKYYGNIEKYNPSKKIDQIEAVFVTDYYDLVMFDGRSAFYVVGSDVYGPMGRELIPFKTKEAAEEFMEDHAGKAIYRFSEITPGIVKNLDQ